MFVDLGDRRDVAGHRAFDLDVVLALELEQMADLERLLAVVDEQLGVAASPCPGKRGTPSLPTKGSLTILNTSAMTCLPASGVGCGIDRRGVGADALDE
jgi:hypothetical protein